MKILTSLQKLLDVDAHFDDPQNIRDNFLVREGNHVHKGLIYIEMVWGGFAIITYLQCYNYQTVLNICLFVFAGLVYSRNSRTALLLEHFDIQPIIREIINGLQTTENSLCNITEEYTGEASIFCDKGRLDTVLRNILTNSVKYRKKGDASCFVNLSFTNTGNLFTIKITDNGEGIPAASLPHVFEMFYRGTSSAPGTGLGLYICKEILDKMKADYRIESTEGNGTMFTFTIKQPAAQKK